MQNTTHTPHQKDMAYAAIAGYCSGYVETSKMFLTGLRNVVDRSQLSTADRAAIESHIDLLLDLANAALKFEKEERQKAGLDA